MTDQLPPASPFAEVSADAWRQQVEKLLKDRPFSSLLTETDDGLLLQPLYPCDERQDSAPGGGDRRRGTSNGAGAWQILERAQHPNPVTANRALLKGLATGATALQLMLQPDGYEASTGVRVVNSDDLDVLLTDVSVEALPIILDAGPHATAYGKALLQLATSRGIASDELQLYFANDPAAALARDGSLPGGNEEIYTLAAKQAAHLLQVAPSSRALAADGRVYHAAGASDAQELAAVMASALQHLRALEAEGVAPENAASQILFRLTLDANIFSGAVKQRALRVLWSNICAGCEAPKAADSLLLHAESAARMQHRFDPWVNQLRCTAATLAAALGGADFVSTHGFDEVGGALPSALAVRNARNCQLMLQQESHLHAVSDPLGGAGFVESYTDELTAAAWQELQLIETEGGLIASLKKGKLQARIQQTKETRLQKIATRQQPLTGVSEFPNLCDMAVEGETINWATELNAALARADTRLIELPDGAPAVAEPLLPSVLGEQYESLRIAALAQETPLKACLLTLGTQAQFSGRSAFASNLLAAGGIHTESTGPIAEVDAAVAAWQAAASTVAILCSSDAVYQDTAEHTAAALRTAGCEHIYMAGKPGELDAALQEAGVKAYAVLGMDAIAFLQQLHTDLGAQS